jgi:signal transduction histidine kinase
MLADLDEMEAMIASTLAFARDDARKEPRVTIDLAALLQSLVDDLSDAGNTVEYAGPEHRTIGCRPVALRRAIGNLIDNALKYGGCARVALLDQHEPGHVAVRIDDDGPGIPVSEQEKVFAPFYRLERSRSRDTGGTGLGLSVARTIARAHGGDVTLLNRPDGGLSATLILAEV